MSSVLARMGAVAVLYRERALGNSSLYIGYSVCLTAVVEKLVVDLGCGF
jgi:hypothetical protein